MPILLKLYRCFCHDLKITFSAILTYIYNNNGGGHKFSEFACFKYFNGYEMHYLFIMPQTFEMLRGILLSTCLFFHASVNRPLVKLNFLISQPKHTLLVLKWTILMRQFFWAPKACVKSDGKKIYTILFFAWKFCLSWPMCAQKFCLSGPMCSSIKPLFETVNTTVLKFHMLIPDEKIAIKPFFASYPAFWSYAPLKKMRCKPC